MISDSAAHTMQEVMKGVCQLFLGKRHAAPV